MAENTKIEWAHHTFNPWIGCTKVGPGCDNCYAEADFDKRRHVVSWGAGQPRKRTAPSTWALPQKWNAEAERLGVRYRVFCASLADVFDNEVPPAWRADLFDTIAATPSLDWLLVTKRIGNAWKMMADACGVSMASARLPLPNVWIGTTITSQAEADRDIPKLLALPAAVRFLSVEPLLGAVSLDSFPIYGEDERQLLNWVIVGGESGSNARPMHPNWARSLRDQCAAAGVPFLFKQWGEWSPRAAICGAEQDFQTLDPQCTRWPDVIRLGEHGRNTRRTENCTPDAGEDVYVQRVGKKAAGRLLDGVQHDGYPSPTCGD